MYRRGERGWHQGHHRDIYPPRNHQPAPYRGGYHDHREHNNYNQYDHNERNYNNNQYMEYQEPTYQNYHEDNRPYHEGNRPYHEGNRPYHEDNQPYHEDNRPYHEHKDRGGYHVRGRHDGSYQKNFRGGYPQSHGESGHYHNLSKSQLKKYPYRGFKPQIKENDDRMKTSTAKPGESVVHNPVHSAEGASSQNVSETKVVPSPDDNFAQEAEMPAQQDARDVQQDTKLEDNKKPTQDETKPVQNGAKPAQLRIPTKEDPKPFSENGKPSEEGIKPLKEATPAKEVVKVENVHIKTEMDKHSGEQVCGSKSSTTEMAARLSCKIDFMKDSKEDIQTRLPVTKQEKSGFSIAVDETQKATFLAKSMHSQEEEQISSNRTVEIPLLGGWEDIPSASIEAAGPSTKKHPQPVVDYGLSNTAKELRKALILAKKDEIELAFSQDCRTFAFVASTLLKKDPSLEVAVSNALRSTLQDIAGRCVQELSRFIDHYDNIPVNISERLQNSNT